VDVYLFPAVVGGGLGDIEEVLAAGRRLARSGYRVILYRRRDHPMPRSVDGPWEWPRLERRTRLLRRAECALTVTPAWGVSAAPSVRGPLGRGGPWELEARDVERAYGRDRTLHVSLEEFARTLTVTRETRERFREGGVPARSIARDVQKARLRRETDAFRSAFERFRAFDRPNVLHLFATFRLDRGFASEFPNTVQTGPLWPRRYSGRPTVRGRGSRREWVWYASPASAETIAPEVVRGLAGARPPIHLVVRTPRPWRTSFPPDRVTIVVRAVDARAWRRRFARAELRIVTGSRTLLEALEVLGPFLYFNGVLGAGRRRRRHRPEKIATLLAMGRRGGVPPPLLRDLADFAGGRRVRAVVERAASGRDGWSRFPRSFGRVEFTAPFDDAGSLIVTAARELGRRRGGAGEVVRAFRSGSKG
jgi:hypothetical protein